MDFIGQIDDRFITEADDPVIEAEVIKTDAMEAEVMTAGTRYTKLRPIWLTRATCGHLLSPQLYALSPLRSSCTAKYSRPPQTTCRTWYSRLTWAMCRTWYSRLTRATHLTQVRPADPHDLPGLPDLPKLPVNTDLGTFGFEGHLAYDIGELQNGNPWTEKQ